MAKLIVMVGVPGSGKSTYAKNHFENNAEILSSDALRKELFGDENNQKNNDILFSELYSRARNFLNNNKNVVIDATNINVFERKRMLKNFEDLNVEKIAVVIQTSIEKCLKQNAQRERRVDDSVIEMFFKNFEMPTTAEGFNKIEIIEN